jgi:hypothetical protein
VPGNKQYDGESKKDFLARMRKSGPARRAANAAAAKKKKKTSVKKKKKATKRYGKG